MGDAGRGDEIGGQFGRAEALVSSAAGESSAMGQEIGSLAEAVSRIGAVVGLIRTIARGTAMVDGAPQRSGRLAETVTAAASSVDAVASDLEGESGRLPEQVAA